MAAKKTSFLRKSIISFLLIVLMVGAYVAYQFYVTAIKSNVNWENRKSRYIYIKHNADFDAVVNELTDKNILLNTASFIRMAEMKGYTKAVKPGKYFIKKEMSNKELINVLKAGLQEKITVTLNNIRTKEQFAGRVAHQIEADSTEIVDLLNDEEYCAEQNATTETILTHIIPQDYKVDTWAIPAKDFLGILFQSYDKFWNATRLQKAQAIGLTPTQVTILASIVQQEQQTQKAERPIIAGVYLNRYKKGMKLQADPTIIFAQGDFSINRVTYAMLNINSPYNTYQNEGLPPGPICIASPNAIDAVLNYKKHDYLYFCAKEDLSGFHKFTGNYAEHQRNAKCYQLALDKIGIK